MSGQHDPGTPPPEVPEEFAAAYRAAYEQAMAAQSVPEHGRHRPDEDASVSEGDEVGLPERTRPIVVGTHRDEEHDDRPTVYEQIRDSWWFVPLLLLLIALGLIVAAYVGGRTFAHHVARTTSSPGQVEVRSPAPS